MKAIFKDYIRTITKSINRFISIVLIIAVGAGFYAGLKSTGPDMRLTADEYYISSGLMDLKIFGNYNIDDGDIELIKNTGGILSVSGEYSLDAFNKENGDNLHVMSLPDDDNNLNKVTLKSGRLPENSDECVVDHTALGKTYKIGDYVELYLKDDDISGSLTKTKFQVVGTVASPMYVSNSRGVSSIGTGTSDGFIMLQKDVFAYDYYTEAYIKLLYGSELSSFSKEYETFVNAQKSAIGKLLQENKDMRYNRLVDVHQKEIDIAEKDGQAAQNEIELCQNSLKDANDALANARNLVEVGENELTQMQVQINSKKSTILNKQLEIEKIISDSEIIQKEIDDDEITLSKEKTIIDEEEKEYLLTEKLHAAQEKSEGYITEMRVWRSQLDEKIFVWEQKRATLDTKITNLETIVSSIDTIKGQINSINIQISEDQSALDDAKEIHNNKSKIINDNEKIVAESELNLKNAEEKLDESLQKIEKANEDIDNIGHIYYFVVDRTSSANYAEYGANADRIDAIAIVFPIFFILVAALVCLTTMTRMVEEDITLIGTYKALGYNNNYIIGKYLFYGFCASIIGNVIGLNIGFRVFPSVIMSAYGLLYNMPSPETPFRWDYSLATTVAGMICTMLTAWAACRNELKAAPSQLMRPKSPKGGKRILLEKISPLWKALSFNAKITLRNLFRYKRRMIMTILGIAGCTALMLTGLGFRNSLLDIVNLQFGDIFKYDLMVTIDDTANEEERQSLETLLADESAPQYYTYQKTIDVMSKSDRITATMIVANPDDDMSEFITLRSRGENSSIPFSRDAVIISEKLALLLDVSEGDTFAMMDTNNNQYQAVVSGITENYAGHYVYMGDLIYSRYFAEIPQYTDILIKTNDSDTDNINHIAESINELDFIRESQLTSITKSKYENQIASMNIIVYVLIVSAAILAFVVMYNLTSINVSERIRELSTIKVLGFYDDEVSGYIGRENIILTAIGIITGLIAGIYLFRYVITTAEVDTMMFGRTIRSYSYIISAGLTMIFTMIVNIGMHFSLRKINMIAALKSVE